MRQRSDSARSGPADADVNAGGDVVQARRVFEFDYETTGVKQKNAGWKDYRRGFTLQGVVCSREGHATDGEAFLADSAGLPVSPDLLPQVQAWIGRHMGQVVEGILYSQQQEPLREIVLFLPATKQPETPNTRRVRVEFGEGEPYLGLQTTQHYTLVPIGDAENTDTLPQRLAQADIAVTTEVKARFDDEGSPLLDTADAHLCVEILRDTAETRHYVRHQYSSAPLEFFIECKLPRIQTALTQLGEETWGFEAGNAARLIEKRLQSYNHSEKTIQDQLGLLRNIAEIKKACSAPQTQACFTGFNFDLLDTQLPSSNEFFEGADVCSEFGALSYARFDCGGTINEQGGFNFNQAHANLRADYERSGLIHALALYGDGEEGFDERFECLLDSQPFRRDEAKTFFLQHLAQAHDSAMLVPFNHMGETGVNAVNVDDDRLLEFDCGYDSHEHCLYVAKTMPYQVKSIEEGNFERRGHDFLLKKRVFIKPNAEGNLSVIEHEVSLAFNPESTNPHLDTFKLGLSDVHPINQQLAETKQQLEVFLRWWWGINDPNKDISAIASSFASNNLDASFKLCREAYFACLMLNIINQHQKIEPRGQTAEQILQNARATLNAVHDIYAQTTRWNSMHKQVHALSKSSLKKAGLLEVLDVNSGEKSCFTWQHAVKFSELEHKLYAAHCQAQTDMGKQGKLSFFQRVKFRLIRLFRTKKTLHKRRLTGEKLLSAIKADLLAQMEKAKDAKALCHLANVYQPEHPFSAYVNPRVDTGPVSQTTECLEKAKRMGVTLGQLKSFENEIFACRDRRLPSLLEGHSKRQKDCFRKEIRRQLDEMVPQNAGVSDLNAVLGAAQDYSWRLDAYILGRVAQFGRRLTDLEYQLESATVREVQAETVAANEFHEHAPMWVAAERKCSFVYDLIQNLLALDETDQINAAAKRVQINNLLEQLYADLFPEDKSALTLKEHEGSFTMLLQALSATLLRDNAGFAQWLQRKFTPKLPTAVASRRNRAASLIQQRYRERKQRRTDAATQIQQCYRARRAQQVEAAAIADDGTAPVSAVPSSSSLGGDGDGSDSDYNNAPSSSGGCGSGAPGTPDPSDPRIFKVVDKSAAPAARELPPAAAVAFEPPGNG